MIVLPSALLAMWLYGLFALLILLVGLLAIYRWLRPRREVAVTGPDRERVVVERRRSRLGWPGTAPLWIGLLLLSWVFFGRHAALMFRPGGSDDPHRDTGGTVQEISRPDGTSLHVESYGPADGPPLVFTHGWGADSTEWYYARKQLADTFHVIVWDLPGLGRSLQPSDQNYSLDRMADDLAAVLASTAGGRPAVLVGHSIGGMINLTFCRRHPEALGRQVAGIVQLDTTYTNPVRTSKAAGRNTMLQKPVYEPILHATVALSPLVHRLNWLAYQSGLLHLQTHRSSFAGTETRGQLDFVTRYYKYDSPAVLARGTLGMLHWDATEVLPHVRVPVLILVGRQDRTTVPAASEQMRASMPAASLQVIDPAAHMGPIERNLTYNSAIRAFADLRLRGGPQLAGAILPARQSLPGVPARGRR